MPGPEGNEKLRHEYSGPTRVGRFGDGDKAIESQWMFHAVSDILIAHSLLRSLPGVDADRIGVTGISWGGILSSLVSGVDTRFKCAIPVYGAGFLYESKGHFKSVQPGEFWDPSNFFRSGYMPTLWVNSDVDGHFSINITSLSNDAVGDFGRMVIHPGMKHGHGAGWSPGRVPEIYVFANQILKGAKPELGRIVKQPSGSDFILNFESETPIVSATVYYIDEALTYRKGKGKHEHPGPWIAFEASVNEPLKTVSARLPEEAKAYYVNLEDANGCILSSSFVELD